MFFIDTESAYFKMVTIQFSEWKSIIVTVSGVSLIVLSFLWLKKERKKKNIKCENERKDVMEFSNDVQTPEALNNVLPELSEAKWVKVGKVEELCFYPLKSGRGQKLSYCDFTELGISVRTPGCFTLKDRAFLVYNEETGKFQTGRQYPTLILISLNPVNETSVKLEAVGMPSLVFKVPLNCESTSEIAECTMWFGEKVKCIDCGPDAAKWISSFLTGTDSGLRLGYAFIQRSRNLNDSPWSKYMNIYKSMRNGDSGIFSDLASYMIMSESSLQDLNKRLEKLLPALQFRPNIVVSGTEPYAEDNWDWIKIGKSAIIRNFKSCTRCKMTCINPETAFVDDEPLRTLKMYREVTDLDEKSVEGNSPKMGIYCGLYVTGQVKVGDDIYVFPHKKQDI